MASSVTTLALTLILIFHFTPGTTAARRLNDQNPTDEAKYLFPPGLPFGGVPPLPSLFPPFPRNVPGLPFPLPSPSSSSPPTSLPGFPGFRFPPLPFLAPSPP
ncbi:hypothetical protein EUTSA_v10017469mg [Eutrema salsugineum]|uniref:Uncharacterized protein n=1 Tax=Eutrema salsugineum TaxID=72664 RepID=V4LNH2_EUTSA|nr:WW domain-binding protein 11 [Eutrema salsugineum]ESQ52095.1 hypothetical protein EUTSA_v10017469mg [Eutrema salsugineum]